MLKQWKCIDSELVHSNPWWSYRRDRFEIPGGIQGEYHYVHTQGSSMVLALTIEGRLVLVKQYRYLCRRDSIEFPCGSVKPGSDYIETARHELAEESGFQAARLEPLASFNPYNGVTDEICRVFLATELAPVAVPADDTEEFEVLLCTPRELESLIAAAAVWDGMTLAAWALCRRAVTRRLRRR
jgi:ADP-ribose pyrophosphatase